MTSQGAKDVKELIALQSIAFNGTKEFVEMQENNLELFNILKDNAIALSMIHADLNKGSTPHVKGTLIGEYYESQSHKKVITVNDIEKFGYEEGSGWKIIDMPEEGKLGLAIRKVEDSFYTEGAGIDLGTTNTDLIVPKHIAESVNLADNNIVKVGDSYRKILTSDHKSQMGIITKPGHSLIHSTSHMIAAQEADIIRKEVLKAEVRSIFETKDSSEIAKVQARIADPDSDHPYFIKLGKGVNYVELDADIKAKYKPVDVKLSNLNGFKNEVSLVRKDMAHWLTGDNATYFNNSPKIQKASKIVKQLVSGAKIGMAVANPAKLMMDTVSNTAFLTAMGVPAGFQVDQGKQILTEMGTLGTLRTEIARLRVQKVAYPKDTELQAKYDNLMQELENHKLNGVVKRGFMNSLSSDIMNNNLDSLSGLQADINKGLRYLLNKDDGSANIVNKFIMDVSNVTGDGTEALKYIGNIVKKADSTKEMGRMLDGAAERIKKIKNKEDAVAYLNNFVLSPNSEIVKGGVWYNDAIDTVGKETYYRYLTEIVKMDPKLAEVKVIESFPDYKENMPMAMKVLSDYGILMFPSYWTRIHLPAYRMLTQRSVSTGIELGLANLTNTHLETILNATIPIKLGTNLDIIQTPTSHIGINSLLPTHLF